MERIRQAVEQASRNRKEKAGQSPSQTPGHPDAVPLRESVTTRDISYAETRCIEVSPSVLEDKRLVAAIPGHPLQDTYRMLRTQILQDLEENNWNTVGVTSPATGCGKSLTSINLAISLAMDLSHTVLLIDADLRNPTIHKYFGYTPEHGLNDYLESDLPLSSVLFHPNIDRLVVLPGRLPIRHSAEALRSPKLKSMIREARARYSDRIIILDLPPVLTTDDAISLAPNLDCMLMIAENGETTKDDLRKSLELLSGVPIIGTVLNKSAKKVGTVY